MISRAEAQRRIAAHPHWYHRIEVLPGLFTPGINDSAEALARIELAGLPRDCVGMRALDVGCRDGFFAFELERRGATVVGVDAVAPDGTGFSIASGILESKVEYRVDNVYNLTAERLGRFDIVLFLGVVYHLRHPLLALERLREVCNEGALIVCESEASQNPQALKSAAALWELVPHGQHEDASVKWLPTPKGFAAAIADSRFEVIHSAGYGARCVAGARAVAASSLAAQQHFDRAARQG
ncbi:MAG: methyltransferase domain-containing protein [Acidobacteriota bacterium]